VLIQLLTKSQRIVAFYILYELYHHENVKSTPFEAVVLSSFQTCAWHLNTETNQVGEENQFKAEFKLLSDFLVSVPKISKQAVKDYITEVEASKEPLQNPIPDIKNYIDIHVANMPRVFGPKAYALTGILRD
jgi:hypothetical protein